MSSAPRVVARLDQLRPGMGHLVRVGGREVALFRTESGVLAIDARCPHAGGPLADGMLLGRTVVCPLHLRRVDLETGVVEDCPDPVRTYPVVIEKGNVLVAVA